MIMPFRVCKPLITLQSHNPAVSPGVAVTPGNNTYGAYSQVMSGAAVTSAAYAIWVNANTINSSGAAKDCLITFGIDPAGGTSYTDFIPDLYFSCASVYAAAATCFGGISYLLPLRIPQGASIGAKASVNNATVGTANVQCRLLCKPSAPESVRCGQTIKAYGSTPASSSGTAVTPANGSEGAYAALGTIGASERPWAWVMGVGINNATITANSPFYDLAIGDASNKRSVITDLPVATTTVESLTYYCPYVTDDAAPGEIIYARAWSVGAPVTGHSAIAYGVI